MKFKLLSLVAMLGLSGAASAQSSVTLFGIVDATLAYGKGSVANRTQMLRGGLNSNRLGFRGVEDLGGGMSASFWLESGMNVDDGTGQASDANNQVIGAFVPATGANAPVRAGTQGLTFNRRSTVSLASTALGELRLGRDYVPQYWNLVFGDPFGNVGVGAAINYTTIITGPTNTRASNQIGYFSPKVLGGFGVQLGHYRGENASNVANEDDGTGTGIRLTYDGGALQLGLGWGRTDYAAGDTVQRNLNAAYDFKVVKVMGTLSRDSNGAVDARGGSVGVVVPVGVGEVKAAYSQYRTDAAGDPEAKKLAVGYVHNLSKRTAVYTTYARVRNSGGSTQALNGATTAANASSSGLDVGLRHSF